MAMNIKPVIISSRGAGVFVDQDGRMELVADQNKNRDRIDILLKNFKKEMGKGMTILKELYVSSPKDYQSLFKEKDAIDVVLLYVLGVTPIDDLLNWQGPIIAFSGQYTPAMALYAVAEERHQRKNLFIALDYQDISNILRVLDAKQTLSQTRIVLFGSPPTWHLRWYGFPDLEAIRRKTGLQFIPVELRELIDTVQKVDAKRAASQADKWMADARQVVEPTPEHLRESAAAYLGMEHIMKRKDAQAMAINCLEITQSQKFSERIINPCMGMSFLRDKGIACGCEMDIAGLLSMILLSNLGQKPAFMGNIVHADPTNNVIKLSHCILPTRMSGFEKDPLPYTLRDYHGAKGVTAFTDIPTGVEVTLARVQRNLERIVALTGEVVACEDTIFCRNTVTIRIRDTREFIRQAEGNHHAMVFGNYLNGLEMLSSLLDCSFQSL
jgi:L-fucose isomerase-like protein